MGMKTTILRNHTWRQAHVNALIDALSGYGVIPGEEPTISQRGAGANMSVDVSAFSYLLAWVAGKKTTTTNVAIDAADATNPRIDLLYLATNGTLTILKGTARAVKPVGETTWQKYEEPYPADSSTTTGILLAEIVVPAGATSIIDAYIRNIAVPIKHRPAGWTQEVNFTATPASTSTLTMTADKTATIKVGMGLKYKISATYYYGMVTAITSNLLTIAGAPLSGDVSELYWCPPERVIQVDFFVSGKFADAANTGLLASDMNTAFEWNLGKAYCVLIRHKVKTDDSGANQPRVSISIAGAVVGTDNTNTGQAVAETWTSTVVGINTSNYDINPDEAIEIVTDDNGTNNDASDLTVSAVFVLE